eukprot:1925783-Prymnesium_polylepis.1
MWRPRPQPRPSVSCWHSSGKEHDRNEPVGTCCSYGNPREASNGQSKHAARSPKRRWVLARLPAGDRLLSTWGCREAGVSAYERSRPVSSAASRA